MPEPERAEVERLKRENESLGRRLRDAEGQATLFRGGLQRKDSEIARLTWALRCIAALPSDEDPRRYAERTLDNAS